MHVDLGGRSKRGSLWCVVVGVVMQWGGGGREVVVCVGGGEIREIVMDTG